MDVVETFVSYCWNYNYLYQTSQVSEIIANDQILDGNAMAFRW